MKNQWIINCFNLVLLLSIIVNIALIMPVYSNLNGIKTSPFPSQKAADQVVFATHFCPNFTSLQDPDSPTTSQRYLYVDEEGNSYLAGISRKKDTKGFNSFLAKFSPEGTLLFSTFFGSKEYATEVKSIAMDTLGTIWIAGHTNDPDFPLIHSWHSTENTSSSNIFFSSLSPEGEWLFSTLWGGSKDDRLTKFSLDNENNLCIIGQTQSTDLPLKNSFFDFTATGYNFNNFVASIDPEGQLKFSSYWLNTQTTSVSDLAIDNKQNLIIGGSTSFLDYPLKDSLQDGLRGQQDAFITKINTKGNILFSTSMGGSKKDEIVSLHLDHEQNLIAIGNTKSQDFPLKNYYWGSIFSTSPEKAFLMTLGKNHQLLVSDIIGPYNARQVKNDKHGNYYLLSSGGGMEDYHYSDVFLNLNLSPGPLSGRNSRIYVFLPNLQAYGSYYIFADGLFDIHVHSSMRYLWFSGTTTNPMPTKNAYQELAMDSAVLGKIQLPPSLAMPNKLLLQIGQEKATFMENGKVTELPPLEAPPMIVQGRTMIPLRVLAETMGMEVSWVPEQQYIWLDREGVRLELQIGRNYAWKFALDTPETREKLEMDVPPMIVNNRTLLPLRFVTENFGALVDWNGVEQKILVSWE